MKRLFALVIVAVALTGCQKPKNSTRVSVGGTARSQGVAPGTTTLPNGVTLNGVVRASTQYQTQFQEAVLDFLEATLPNEYVGTVAADASNNTGVWFGGRVELANGQNIRASNGNVQIAQNSEIYIAVYDSYAAQGLDVIPGVYLKSASGYVQGNSAYIKFSDAYGYVELSGQMDANTFTGTFKYNTQRTHDGRAGHSGTMGTFTVPTCSFFRCQ